MGSAKTLSGHAATALFTLAVVSLWMGQRDARRAAIPAARPAQAALEPSAVAAAPIPPEVLAASDADEQINIRVYAAVNRSVVNITTAATSVGLFGDESTTGGSGSGFVFDAEGHILTNFHVVQGADSVQVTLHDGTASEAHVVGFDESNDVAVIRVDLPAGRLAPIPLGDSAGLVVGQKVLALGNPFGLERTLTTGIISSLDRSIKAKNGRTIKGIIQTDAAINPGNSGGPLLNSRGEVIGMNTAILSQVGQSAGIGFAVPIASIRRILRPLIEKGRVTRPDLGLTRVYRTAEGLLVLGVVPGGPADRAGLRPLRLEQVRRGRSIVTRPDPEWSDLIVAIDGKPVKTYDDLLAEVEAHNPGDAVAVTVVRGGRPVDLSVTLGES